MRIPREEKRQIDDTIIRIECDRPKATSDCC
jgi:hypothetical protein